MVGKAAPDFIFSDEAGNEFKLSDFEGQYILLNFWASWCPPCRSEMPAFQQEYEAWREDVKFIMLNVQTNGETPKSAQAFLDENGYTFPLYLDSVGSASAAFGITGIPETFAIDPSGIVTARHVGAIDQATLYATIETAFP
jgi:thiol-disulfide isomerase/thioredoxin